MMRCLSRFAEDNGDARSVALRGCKRINSCRLKVYHDSLFSCKDVCQNSVKKALRFANNYVIPPLATRRACGIILLGGRIAQLVRAPPLQGGGRRFESCSAHCSSGTVRCTLRKVPVYVGEDDGRWTTDRGRWTIDGRPRTTVSPFPTPAPPATPDLATPNPAPPNLAPP